jgi:hypothetical protein
MKKPTTTKSAKSPAPATSKSAAVSAPAPVKKSAAPVKAAAAAAKPVAPKAAPAAAPAPAPSAKATAPFVKAPSVPVDPVNPPASSAAFTEVTAKVDVGFGNTLFIRGEGPGLSWNKGLPLKNAGHSEWTIALPRAARPILFKFLVNDELWSLGVDYSADPGSFAVLTPEFNQG